MKAIQTQYNGYHFRSRLEARWAVFFEAINLAYLYEPEGFEDEEKNVRYLPDFHFHSGLRILGDSEPNYNVRVEIKPSLEISDVEREKIATFLKETDDYILLIGGDPSLKTQMRLLRKDGAVWEVPFVGWTQYSDDSFGLVEVDEDGVSNRPKPTGDLERAFRAAKKARFEESADLRMCRECRELFRPKRAHFHTCSSCFQKSHPAIDLDAFGDVSDQIVVQPSTNRATKSVGSTPSIWKRLAVAVGILVFLLPVVYFGMDRAIRDFTDGSATPTEIVPTDAPMAIQPTTVQPTSQPQVFTLVSECDCSGNKYNCSDFDNRGAAQACFDACYPTVGDIHFLDMDENEDACESLDP